VAISDIIKDKLKNFFKTKKETVSTEDEVPRSYKGWGGVIGHATNWYFDSLRESASRQKKYREYRYLDKNLGEASAALNVYSDNIVSGAVGGEENYSVYIDPKTPNAKRIEEVIEELESRTRIKDDIWDIARDTLCYGDSWEEIVISKSGNNLWVEKLKTLPVEEIYARVDRRGRWIDIRYPYSQKANIADKDEILFKWWQIIHFKMGKGVYGVDRSIFSNASRRIGRQLLWIDDSMVLARLSRAYMRYAFMVDTTGLPLDDKFRFAEEFLERVRRKDIIDRYTGRISPVDSPWMPDEDIVIPVEKDSPQGIEVLEGDLRLGNIDDVKYFQEKFFIALNIPKAYVSKEEGVKAKATITQLDVQFARQVRRKQRALRPGLRKLYQIAFYLNGIDPDSFKWDITFPPLATMDELLRWEMEEVKARIAETYTVKIGALNNLWILERLLGFSKDDIKRYSLFSKEDMKEGMALSPETAAAIRKDPYLRQVLDDLKDLVSWQLEREKAVEDMKPVGVNREEDLSDKWE